MSEIKYDPNKAHYIVATAIIIKDGKYLIAQRAAHEKAFPSEWTVPGGKLNLDEYATREKDAGVLWYNILENLVKREVDEEVGLRIKNINYVTNLAYVREDGIPTLIISLCADYDSGEIKLCEDLTDYAWVSLEEAKNYKLIDGIREEIEMLDRKLNGGERGEWSRSS